MQIVDFDRKGNIVRFYLGDLKDEPQGDDWDDAPYEHNAGTVYGRYVKGHKDIAFPFDDLVLEPCDGVMNSGYSKEDMLNRRLPCIIVVPAKLCEDDWHSEYDYWKAADGVKKYYFGDEMMED